MKTSEMPKTEAPRMNARATYFIARRFLGEFLGEFLDEFLDEFLGEFLGEVLFFLECVTIRSPQSTVVPMGQIWPQNALPRKGPDKRMANAGMNAASNDLSHTDVTSAKPGSSLRKKSGAATVALTDTATSMIRKAPRLTVRVHSRKSGKRGIIKP